MLSLLVLLWATGFATASQVTVLRHATVIDGTGGGPVADGTIVISRGRIEQIGPDGRIQIPAGAEVVDLTGKTVIPGIINLHGHVGLVKDLNQDMQHYTLDNVQAQLRTYALYGVTTTTSLGVDSDLIVQLRNDRSREPLSEARVYTALQGFTCPNGYPTHIPSIKGVVLEVSSPSQARASVEKLAERGADVVKIWVDDHHDTFEKLDPTVYGAIIDQAHKHNLKVFAHVYELSDARQLVEAGIDVLAHSIRDVEVDPDLITRLKRNQVTVVATLSREQSTFIYAEPPGWLDSPFFRRGTTPDIIDAVKTVLGPAQSRDPEARINQNGFETAMRNLKRLADAGVRIGFGTDSGPPGRFQGFFAHWEMELMVQAGLSPMQVIESFSKHSAEALGISGQFGTLGRGKVADLVVLDQNPLADIRNSRTIHAVYLGGKKFPR